MKVDKVEIVPKEWSNIGPHLNISGRKLNMFGAWFLMMSCFFYAPAWLLGLYVIKICSFVRGKNWNTNLSLYDNVSRWWAHNLLKTGFCFPEIIGHDFLPSPGEPVMFVANHSSWFDIVAISLIMDNRAFKFVSKAELLKVPVMGFSLKLGGHVMIQREDQKSQIATFKDGVKWLQQGVSLVTFAEGTRSKDGVIRKFKRGAFKMAMHSKVKIVPVSLVGMHRAFPSWSIMPICPGRDFMKVVIHSPIEISGKTEEEISNETYQAICNGLPADQINSSQT
jgi:1-acyl-sn-glycerol-3-phosphate acyltransferase